MLTLTEAKRLVARWGKGTFETRLDNIRDHVRERGGGDTWAYLRVAYEFNKTRSTRKTLPNGRTRFTRKSGEFLIEHNGYIVTHGFNRPKQNS